MSRAQQGFTLSEVLITLGVIGIVASMTIPSLVGKFKDKQFKTAYKKAYSDMSNAFQEGIYENQFNRSNQYDKIASAEELAFLKKKFRVLKDCKRNLEPCWVKGDTVCGGACSSGNSKDGIDMEHGAPYKGRSECFLDSSGRAWCVYSSTENLYLIDTNGSSNPNRFGKDRWIFTFADSNNKRTNNYLKYKKVIPMINYDVTEQYSFCKRPPCYYQSWLLN